MNNVNIIGGGTFNHVRNHLSLAVPAFGQTARQLVGLFNSNTDHSMLTSLHLTKMADSTSDIVTNDDVSKLVDVLIADPNTKVIVFNVALCDFTGSIGTVESGKYAKRLQSRSGEQTIILTMADKLLSKIRKVRKDIFLVAFKTTSDATSDEQYKAGLNLLKANSVNLVLANDTVTRNNMIIAPEETRYCETTDRTKVLRTLVEMTVARSQLHFTRSTIVDGQSIDWDGPEVPPALRTVVNHCIQQGAYKTFRGVTAGHFAYKVDPTTFITSKRKTNYNDLDNVGLVRVESTGRDNVTAYGARPSVGGMSQRIVFDQHPDVDCIVHFHSPMKPGAHISSRPQQWLECGSHECGQNTSDGLELYEDGIKAVYLDDHGPNVVFNRSVDPNKVIAFIDRNFDLAAKTGGLVG